MGKIQPDSSRLCYLESSKVTSPAGALSEFNLLSADGKPLGSIEGVVIDAARRRISYYDVRSRGVFNRRFLVPTDRLAQVERERKTLRLLGPVNPSEVKDIDVSELREFSDDDLMEFFFPSAA
jgi:hypothetical protein